MNAPLLRRLFRAALVVSVLFGTSSSLADSSPLGITTDPALPNALTDISYRQPVEASGGQGPYTWEIVDRADWPDWLYEYNLADSGELYGWPDNDDIGTHVFALRATDSEGRTAEKTFTLVVEENPNHRPEIVSRTPSEYSFVVATGDAVRLSVEASDPDGDPLTYAWWGYDPNGNWFSSTGGEAFEFVPETNGFHEVNVNVDDGMFSCDTVSWRIWAGDVEPLEIVTETNLPDAMEGVSYSVRLEATGGAGGHQWEHSHFTLSHETNSFSETGAPLLDWNGRIWREEGGSTEVELPFDFPFGNETVHSVYVTDDGAVRHDGDWWSPLRPLVVDFDGTRQTIYTNSPAEGAFTIRWDTFVYGTDDAASFSVTLYSDGSARFAFGTIPDVEDAWVSAWGWWVDVSLSAQTPHVEDIVLVPRGELPNGLSVDSYYYDGDDYVAGGICGAPREDTAGTYSFDLSVTDALGNKATKTFTLVVADNPNREPRIEARFPEREDVRVSPGESVDFTVVATDPDGQPLRFEWTLGHGTYDDWGNWMWKTLVTNATTGSESTFVLPHLEESEEDYQLFCDVIDGPWTNFVNWWISVRPPLAIVTETLPDTTEMTDYFVRLEATNEVGWVDWSVDTSRYSVLREPSSYAETGRAILGPLAGSEEEDDPFWVPEYCYNSRIVDLPFSFSFGGSDWSEVEVFADGSLGLVIRTPNGPLTWRNPIAPCRFNPDCDRTNVFVDDSVPGAVTFRWDGIGTPYIYYYPNCDSEERRFRFAATLHADGTVRFSYGSGNYGAEFFPSYGGNDLVYVSGMSDLSACFRNGGMDGAKDVVLAHRGDLSFPPGLDLSYEEEGVLSGRPTEAGDYSFYLVARDRYGQEDRRLFTISVAENPNRPVVVDSCDPESYDGYDDPSDSVYIGESRTFSVAAHDPEGEPVSFQWSVDGELVAGETGGSFTYAVTEADFLPDEDGWIDRDRWIVCSVSDGVWTKEVEWHLTVGREWFVDAETAAENPDGTSWQSAFATLREASETARSGDRVYVRPGIYSPETVSVSWSSDENGNPIQQTKPCAVHFDGVELIGTDGPEATIIDGEDRIPCLCLDGGTVSGFTLRNGREEYDGSRIEHEYGDGCIYSHSRCGLSEAKLLSHCIVSNCVFIGSLAKGCTLDNCIVVNNRGVAYRETAHDTEGVVWVWTNTTDCVFSDCRLHHCTVAENRLEDSESGGALDWYCEAFNSIVWNNRRKGGTVCNYEEGEAHTYVVDGAEDPVRHSTRFDNCCLNAYHENKEGLVLDNPRFANLAHGDVRLCSGSPCIDAGSTVWDVGETDAIGNPRLAGTAPDIGALEGALSGRHVVSVVVQGRGRVDPDEVSVPAGGSATFLAVAGDRPFLGFFDAGGVRLSAGPTWTVTGVSAHRTVFARFATNCTLHVSAANGSDRNDGFSWEAPVRSIRRAVEIAEDGETVRVDDGIYEPFATQKALRIESVNGSETTVVDGGGTNGCVSLGTDAVLEGFTLRNGKAWRGGGAWGGTLVDCTIQGNYATECGGGLYDSTAIRCRIVGNVVRADETNGWIGVLAGGGACGCTLVNCLVADNEIVSLERTDRALGGGTFGGAVRNCTVVGNRLSGPGYLLGGGAFNGTLVGSIVSDNVAGGSAAETYLRNGLDAHRRSETFWILSYASDYVVDSTYVGGASKFVDSAGGNYRLRADSPCVDAGQLGENAEWNDLDLDGSPRVRGAAVDQGCYESIYAKTKTSTTPVPVPFAWLDSHYADLAIRGGYEDRASSTAANGVDEIWKCFVTGVVPTDEDDRFLATIEMVDGEPEVRWSPDLNEGGTKNERVYTVEGKTNLVDSSWGPTNEATRFFRVKVEMP